MPHIFTLLSCFAADTIFVCYFFNRFFCSLDLNRMPISLVGNFAKNEINLSKRAPDWAHFFCPLEKFKLYYHYYNCSLTQSLTVYHIYVKYIRGSSLGVHMCPMSTTVFAASYSCCYCSLCTSFDLPSLDPVLHTSHRQDACLLPNALVHAT